MELSTLVSAVQEKGLGLTEGIAVAAIAAGGAGGPQEEEEEEEHL